MNEYLVGDAIEVLKTLPDESVQMVITSPPYWGLRTYGDEGQYGLEPTPEEHVARMVEVFREVRRVLRKDGVLFLNYGDTYAANRSYQVRNSKHCDVGNVMGMSTKPIAPSNEQIPEGQPCDGFRSAKYLNQPQKVTPGLKPKDLCLIPFRIALALQADGWWVRQVIIWSKPNPMPESCTDRPTTSHEYIFLMSRSGNSQYWTHRDLNGTRIRPKPDYRWVHTEGYEVTEEPKDWRTSAVICPECKGTQVISIKAAGLFSEQVIGETECDNCAEQNERLIGGKRVKPGPGTVWEWERINLWDGHDYFYDAEAVREKNTEGTIDRLRSGSVQSSGDNPKNKEIGRWGGKDEYNNPSGRNCRSVWEIATQPFPAAHFATFPEKLVERCIMAGTSPKACPHCGAAWERVMEKGDKIIPSGRKRTQPIEQRTTKDKGWNTEAGFSPETFYESKTIGFRPTCDCQDNDGSGKCVVLDPFMGSGTTAVVAESLGRKSIGIDINPKYKDMSMRRLGGATIGLSF